MHERTRTIVKQQSACTHHLVTSSLIRDGAYGLVPILSWTAASQAQSMLQLRDLHGASVIGTASEVFHVAAQQTWLRTATYVTYVRRLAAAHLTWSDAQHHQDFVDRLIAAGGCLQREIIKPGVLQMPP